MCVATTAMAKKGEKFFFMLPQYGRVGVKEKLDCCPGKLVFFGVAGKHALRR